jgi:uncharacterized YigZ family protein
MEGYIITHPVQHELVVEKSRFLCTLRRAVTEAEAQASIRELKKEYWDATHNCSAYIIGTSPRAERSNDDGEPSGTAGSPMLEVLRQKKIYNVVAVVTRYFGGIKLGAGGLTRTYARSVSEAVQAAGLSVVIPMARYTLSWPLDDVGRVLNQLYRQSLFTVADVHYGNVAAIFLEMPAADKVAAEQWLTETLSRKIDLGEGAAFQAEQVVVPPLS